LTPVAVFDTVEIDGCEVSRASLHNLTFIKELELKTGCRVLVSKRNMIIPHIEENLDRDGFDNGIIPNYCPCCAYPTRIQEGKKDKVETLRCDNPDCSYQRLRQFVHFVGKKAMDIEGLSEATLEKFINRGWLETFADIYRLDRYRGEIVVMDGFGEKSWRRLWDSIQKSRNTTFERFVVAMDIPMVGRTASRELKRYFDGNLDALVSAVHDGFDFTQLHDFGGILRRNIHSWFRIDKNILLWKEMRKMVNIENKTTKTEASENPFSGKTIVVTGTLENFTRNSINAKIEELGAKAGSAVSAKTDFLICGEKAGSKLDKARSLGVTVLTEREFLDMAEGA
jgi:DNA ligase (NAD+)